MKIDLGITVGNMAENYGSNYVINHVVVNDIKKLGRGGWCQRTGCLMITERQWKQLSVNTFLESIDFYDHHVCKVVKSLYQNVFCRHFSIQISQYHNHVH